MSYSNCILKEAISYERMRELQIRVSRRRIPSSALTGDPVDPVDGADEPIEVWSISNAGMHKLRDYGYLFSAPAVSVNDMDGDLCFLQTPLNPDETLASADVDPRNIRTINVLNWNGSALSSEFIRIARQTLLPAIEKNIDISVPHAARVPPEAIQPHDSRTFRIHIWGSPSGGSIQVAPSTINGLQLITPDVGRFGEYLQGIPIVSPEGDEVAAMDRGNLFIYYDICHTNDERNYKIFEFICSKAADIARGGFSDVPDSETVREMYVSKCAARLGKQINELREAIRTHESSVRSCQEGIVKSVRDCRRCTDQLRALEQGDESLRESLTKEFDNLLSIKKIKAIRWRGDKFTVRTDDLYCVDPRSGDEHHIGEFDIIIDSVTSSVRFLNNSHAILGYSEDMQAPHVFSDGRPCLGSLESTIPSLVADYEWSAVIQVCLAFLQSVNVDDAAGKHIDKWPISRTSDQIAAERAGRLAEVAEGCAGERVDAVEDTDESAGNTEEADTTAAEEIDVYPT